MSKLARQADQRVVILEAQGNTVSTGSANNTRNNSEYVIADRPRTREGRYTVELMEGRCAGWAGEVNEPQSGGSRRVPRKEATPTPHSHTQRQTGENKRQGKRETHGNTREITGGMAGPVTVSFHLNFLSLKKCF